VVEKGYSFCILLTAFRFQKRFDWVGYPNDWLKLKPILKREWAFVFFGLRLACLLEAS
jgi:hypothetical protein